MCLQIARLSGTPYNAVAAIVELFLEQIKDGVQSNNDVKLRGFGRFIKKPWQYKDQIFMRILFNPAKEFKELIKEDSNGYKEKN
jgi:nucleoid DNA-binding protein